MGGVSSDVLRRQHDGRWLIAVDNPWGATILEQR
jgi:ketosteroid isomerase-like protein